eukprot:scaffold62683_cov17-Tisochrysis_lutea.AAC.2
MNVLMIVLMKHIYLLFDFLSPLLLRLVADWGKEARHPFLDEGFMAALLDTPLHAIADLRAPPGECQSLSTSGRECLQMSCDPQHCEVRNKLDGCSAGHTTIYAIAGLHTPPGRRMTSGTKANVCTVKLVYVLRGAKTMA